MYWASLYLNFETVQCFHNLFVYRFLRAVAYGWLARWFLATLVGTILGDYLHVYIHSYGGSILHIMQGVLQQLMSVNEPKII